MEPEILEVPSTQTVWKVDLLTLQITPELWNLKILRFCKRHTRPFEFLEKVILDLLRFWKKS